MNKKKSFSKFVWLLGIILLFNINFNSYSNAWEEKQEANKESLVIKTEYIYDAKTNTITGKIHSNNPLKDTKVSWELSEDKLTYTTILKSNGSYMTMVEDIYGNITQVLIDVTRN